MRRNQEDLSSRVEELEGRLYYAVHGALDLLPAPVRELLGAYTWCSTRDDLRRWEQWVIERALALAEVHPAEEMGDYMRSSPRAYCPICGDSSSSPYSRGYAFPTGLTWHLEGSRRSARCIYFKMVWEQARDEVRERQDPNYRGPDWSTARRGPRPWEMPTPAAEPVLPTNVVKLRG